MKKTNWKRIRLVTLQHLVAVFILLALAGLLLNSYIEVESIDGTKVYKIFPVDKKQEFEESEIYHDLFRNAVSDITQFVVIRSQMETEDSFDASKRINVTEYASKTRNDNGCKISAEYELDDLIKWGKYGVSYTMSSMSVSEFVNYFGNVLHPENFTLDDEYETDDQKKPLRFKGFYVLGNAVSNPVVDSSEINGQTSESGTELTSGVDEQTTLIREKMAEYTRNELEDMVFLHIMASGIDGVEVSDENGKIRVFVSLLNNRYKTVEGEEKLINLANNWVDYMKLQSNVILAINNLEEDYQRYLICNKAYSEENSNIKYMIRMMTSDGIRTFTNVSKLKDTPDEDVTEFFSECRRYLIYYPDSLEFMGNTILSEEEIYKHLKDYEYAYPDTTHIWFGMDTNYSLAGDAFYKANAVYNRIVPNINRIILLICVLVFFWLLLGIYLTVTAGVSVDDQGQKTYKLSRFDHVWTEFLVLFAVILGFGAFKGAGILMDIVEFVDAKPAGMMKIEWGRWNNYLIFALFGIYLSVSLDFVWYSLVRRIKTNSIIRGSLIRLFFVWLGKSFQFIFRHRSVAINTLLPYNMYLFINLIGVIVLYKYQAYEWVLISDLAFIVVFNGIVGVINFRKSAEQKEIIEGINRIRDGEVDFKLDSENLHGTSRELADAVNNIGEGIRKAVKTSMKDEQMKTDLITNVSHDIKTPLTSIINYVDLLKRLKISEEPAKGYIDILDNKAHRLKQLTDDLVEASKISSGNIVLNLEKINLTELINQSIGEFSEKFEESGLQIVFESKEVQGFIFADSRRMWRVVENLFNNLCKYSMEGTRVYIDIEVTETEVSASIKNISKQQMNIKPEELTERFIRGDSARSTEGSGLGLSIARSLVEVQGGNFQIYLDGDLFKVTITFPTHREIQEEAEESVNL